MNPRYRALEKDESEIARIRDELDRDGIGQLEAFLKPEAVEKLQQQVTRMDMYTKGWVPDAVDRLVGSDFLRRVINNVLGSVSGRESLVPSPVQTVDIRASVNGLRGPGYVKHLHFDRTYLNIMVPIVIPDVASAHRGQLTIHPNIRSFAGTTKDRWVIPALVRFRAVRTRFKSREIDYKPGDLYFFYGYRTLHGVTARSDADRCVVGITVDMQGGVP